VRGSAPDTWVVFSEELRVHLRSRWYLFFTLAVVLLLIVAMVVVPLFQSDEEVGPTADQDFTAIGFVDQSGSFGGLESDRGPRQYETVAAGLQAVISGEVEALYVITPDYLRSGEVEEYARFEGRFPSPPASQGTFSTLLLYGLLQGKVDPDVLARAIDPAIYHSLKVQDDGTVSELTPTAEAVGGLLVPLLFAGLLAFGLTIGSSYMVQNVSEEKESRVVEVVITSASPTAVMSGKLLALVAMGLGQAAVWIVAASLTVPAMLGQMVGAGEFTISGGMWVLIIVSFLTGYYLTTTVAIFLGAIAPSNREASRMSGWVPLLSFVPFWFVGVIIWQPDGLVARLLSYIPFTAPTGILVRISVGGEMTVAAIAAALVGVIVVATIFFWVAARVFRVAILMRGQSFSRRNLWTALRRAS